MSMDFNANQFRGRGLPFVDEQDSLGCVMLDTAEPVLDRLNDAELLSVLRAREHHTEHADRFWIKGLVGLSDTSHVTLLYGLLPQVTRAHVDLVLEGWECPTSLNVNHVGYFPSPYPDEPYACLVAHLTLHPTGALAEAHARLSMLPHIDTHALYRAHVTLGYIDHTGLDLDALVAALDANLGGAEIETGALNYGRSLR